MLMNKWTLGAWAGAREQRSESSVTAVSDRNGDFIGFSLGCGYAPLSGVGRRNGDEFGMADGVPGGRREGLRTNGRGTARSRFPPRAAGRAGAPFSREISSCGAD